MTIAGALERLRAAADDGRLEQIAHAHGVRLLTVFGSALRDVDTARDLDVAVSLATGPRVVLALLEDLSTLAGTDFLDLLVLDRASPTARRNALVGALPLFESAPGLFARMQMAAALEFYETAWLRELDIERMATS